MKLLADDKIRKLNELLDFRKRFGNLEYRIILLAVLQMTWDNDHEIMYPIYIQNVFFEDVQYNYENFKNAIVSLHSYAIIFEDGNQYSIITKSSGSINNENIIEIRFHDSVQIFLLNFKTKNSLITFYNAIFLKEEFSIKLYEVLKKFQNEEISDFDCDFEDLKKLYLVTYQKTKNLTHQKKFDISIIQNAVDEINEQCDLYAMCEVLDDKKIHFTIKKNKYFLDGRYIEYREINDRTIKIFSKNFE